MKKIEIPKAAVLLSVLFAPVNVAGQTPAGQDSPFTGANKTDSNTASLGISIFFMFSEIYC